MAPLVIGAAVIVAVIWAFVAFPTFRIVVGILVLAGAGLYFVLSEQSAQSQKTVAAKKEQDRIEFEARQRQYCGDEKKRWTIVAPADVEVRDPLLASSYGDEFKATAAVKNKSNSKLTALRINVTALDCPTKDARQPSCDIVGRADETFFTAIPAGEVRKVDQVIKLRDVPKPRGVFTSRFTVASVRAAIDQSDDTSGLLERYLYTCD